MAQMSLVLWLCIVSSYMVFSLVMFMEKGLSNVEPKYYPGLILCAIIIGLFFLFVLYLLLMPLLFVLGVPLLG